MAKLAWNAELDTGIDVIDKQHRVIVDYINQLDDARTSGHKRETVGIVIGELIDYTISHFGFEESMQEEARYPFAKAHKKVHELFIKRVSDYQELFRQGEDVSDDLHKLMSHWLISHIKGDDDDYVPSIRENLARQEEFIESKKGFFSRLFH